MTISWILTRLLRHGLLRLWLLLLLLLLSEAFLGEHVGTLRHLSLSSVEVRVGR